MSILDLPAELYFLIAEYITSPCDLNHLLLAHRGLAIFIAPVLAKYAATPPYAIPALFCFAASRNALRVKSHLEEVRKWDPDITTDVESIILQGPNLVWDVIVKEELAPLMFPDKAVTQRALHWAIVNEKLSMIRYLILQGADIEYRDPKTGGKAIDHVILKGNAEIVKILIENGADVSVWEFRCGSLLHCTIDCLRKVSYSTEFEKEIVAYEKILVLLLRGGADINVCDKYGHTALHLAVPSWPEVIPLLLEWGADINARDSFGNTPLHLAAQTAQTIFGFVYIDPNMRSIKTLLAMGADTTIKNDAGREALDGPQKNLQIYYRVPKYLPDSRHTAEYMLRLVSLQGGRYRPIPRLSL
ncbi:ankyrin repeat-containing domain protein [Morchella snyderi]|nr:ankyrin repeat-containing domain protein [Morchella snyderi]